MALRTDRLAAAPACWLAAGFLLTFSSAFGQTFFIAVFAEDLKRAFAIGDGVLGASYTVATLASSAILMTYGRVADRERLRWVAVATLGGLAATTLALAAAPVWWLLPVLFLGLRFFGQAMLGHVALTAMARWFSVGRGKAIAVAAMGNPAAQAVFPVLGVALASSIGWRWTWAAAAAFLVAVAVPLVVLLLRDEPGGDTSIVRGTPTGTATVPDRVRHWTRGEVLRDPLFYFLMPGVLAPPFVVTGIFFHQVSLVHAKGLELTWFTGWFAAHAGSSIATTFLTGWAVDRFGSAGVLPFFLVPLALGTGLLGLTDHPMVVPAFMVLAGMSSGAGQTLLGALWADLYGTRHIGAIRALASSGGVFASAIAPGLMGVLIDWRVALDSQLLALCGYTVASILLLGLAVPRVRARNG
ncbi:MFS transporter [Prosthecomicrobium sp. N25]|uniref:MFS transporter n=1 Tax=Prosthecomicrobium sp. N25 TaxID=3129254 RepID=UPI00307880E5